jgi:putative spermidine/putrescine transport system ATP-binding protein
MYPRQLSGGQQQRIALARSLVLDPRVLLLDEPLGALDKALRESMQFEIRAMQQRLGITTLLVTHDLAEAVRLADTILVLGKGRPASIVAVQTLSRPPRLRDDAYVEAALSRLIADRDIRAAFDLDPAIAP